MLSFPSKVDLWLAAVLVLATLVAISVAVAATVSAGMGGLGAWVTPVIMLVVFRAVVWPIRYDVDPEQLVIHFGFFRKRVPVHEIARVTPSRNPLSSPALSLDRLRIDYRKGKCVLISPADRAGFALAIRDRAPSAVIDERLLPATKAPRTAP